MAIGHLAVRWGQVCWPWWVGPQRAQGGGHGIRVCMVGITALQGVGICSRWRGPRATMVLLLLLLLLLLLVVMVMCWGWWVGSGLSSSRRREGAWVGIAVG